MPGFCTGCGTPITGAFCSKCGKRAETPGAPAQTQGQPAPASAQPSGASVPASAVSVPVQSQPVSARSAPAQAAPVRTQPPPVQAQPAAAVPVGKPSGAGKAILIVGGILLLFVVMGIAGVLYGVHWMKSKVSAITGGAIGGSQVRVTQGNACSLLSTADVQIVLGVNILKSAEIMEGSDPGCAYYTNSEGFTKLQNLAVEQAKRDSEKVSKEEEGSKAKSDNPLALLKHTKEMEGIVKGLGLTQPDQDGKVFSFTVDRNFGSGSWATLRTTMSLVPGFEEVPDVGDHAMIGSFGHAFYMVKGGNMVHMDTSLVPEARNRGSDLGKKLAGRM